MSCLGGVEALRRCSTMWLVTLQNIEVFADIWCPFTHVGLRMIDSYRKKMGKEDVAIIVKSWPLEWVNSSPMDPVKTEANCTALRQQVASDAFVNVDFGNFPKSTLDALAFVAQAYNASTELGEKASFAIRDALFERGEDIADPAVLQSIGEVIGLKYQGDLNHDAVKREWEEGKTRGVQGSPHFFHGEDGVFCPSLQISRTEENGLSIHTDTLRLQQFLESCFLPRQGAQ